jgi:GNAT superfamily N-acetyltransferase
VEITIEEIGPAQIERARELMLTLHRHEMSVQPNLGSAPGRADEEFWRHYSGGFADWYGEQSFALIAVVDGEDAGFLFATDREALYGYESSERIGYVEDIAVLDRLRGAGVGRALMDEARARFRAHGFSHYELSSVPGNEDAREFYTRLGLEVSAIKLIGDA